MNNNHLKEHHESRHVYVVNLQHIRGNLALPALCTTTTSNTIADELLNISGNSNITSAMHNDHVRHYGK